MNLGTSGSLHDFSCERTASLLLGDNVYPVLCPIFCAKNIDLALQMQELKFKALISLPHTALGAQAEPACLRTLCKGTLLLSNEEMGP